MYVDLEHEQEQVATAIAAADPRHKARYGTTPVYPSGMVIAGGGGRHLGSGVFGWRCPDCGKLLTDSGSSGMSLYRHRVDEHNWSPPPLLPESNRSL